MNSTSQISQKLQQTGDFLTITRENPEQFPHYFQFNINQNNGQTLVRVFDTGIIQFEPQNPQTNKDIVLSSGVHGNETAPIEICAELVQKLILGEIITKHRVLFLFGNPPAMNVAQRFVEENLNRLFSGGHSQDQGQGAGLINKERVRALILEQSVRNFYQQGSEISNNRQRFHYDLHTAIRGSKNEKFAVYPFRHGKPWDKQQIQFLAACGVNTILLSGSPTTTFSYFSSHEFGAHAFTVELGKVKPFGENDMSKFSEVKATLIKLITESDLAFGEYQPEQHQIYKINQVINRQHQNFKLHFADEVENFTEFAKGSVLATDGDIEYKAQEDGEAIIFPNANVAIGQRALLTVVPTKV